MILAFIGNGKGKTTSALGTALRSLNLGKKVLIIQLFKNKNYIKSNEIDFLIKLKLRNLLVRQFGRSGWVDFQNPKRQDFEICARAMEFIIKTLDSSKKVKRNISDILPDLIVFDEVLLANFYNLCEDNALIKLFEICTEKSIDLIVTGQKCKKELFRYFDLITEMKKIKHPFDKGIKAREGLDF